MKLLKFIKTILKFQIKLFSNPSLDNSLENISKLKAIKSIINQILKIHSIKANVIIETSVNTQILKDKVRTLEFYPLLLLQ